MIKAFNYLTEWPKFEKSFNRDDSHYIKNSLFEKTILSTVQRSIRRMSNVTLMRPNNGVHRPRLQQPITLMLATDVGDKMCQWQAWIVIGWYFHQHLPSVEISIGDQHPKDVTRFLLLSPILGRQHQCSRSNRLYIKHFGSSQRALINVL